MSGRSRTTGVDKLSNGKTHGEANGDLVSAGSNADSVTPDGVDVVGSGITSTPNDRESML